MQSPTMNKFQSFVVILHSVNAINNNLINNLIKLQSGLTITLRPRQNGRHSPDDILKCIFLNENVWISIKISLKFVPPGSPNNKFPALVQIMTWRRPGDKLLSEPMIICLLTHVCGTRPQWVMLWLIKLHPSGISVACGKGQACSKSSSLMMNINPLSMIF